MKRRSFIWYLGILPSLFFVFSCKKYKFPTTPTVIKGKVIDQDGLPVKGLDFVFGGTEGIPGKVTFSSNTFTDSEGNFSFSQIIPKETDQASITPIGSEYNLSYSYSLFYLSDDGSFKRVTDPHYIGRGDYGKTTVVDYQLRKL